MKKKRRNEKCKEERNEELIKERKKEGRRWKDTRINGRKIGMMGRKD